jgi:heptosyltransferase III
MNYDEFESAGFRERVKKLKALNAHHFIHVFPVREIAFLARLSQVPVRTGTRSRWYHWLTCNRLLKIHRRNSQLHESQLNMMLLAGSGRKAVPSLDEIRSLYGFSRVSPLPENLRLLLDKTKKRVILHPTSKGSAPEWGLDNFAMLIRILLQSSWQVIIGGTTEDRTKLERLFAENPGVTDACGKSSLQEYISLIYECDGLVAASTGPLHIAAALGKRAVGLYSSRRPVHPGRWGPVGPRAIAMVSDAGCKQCATGQQCSCIAKISPAAVLDLLEQ